MVPSAAKGTLAANIVLPILAIIAVCLRFYARRIKSISIKGDDHVIVVAMVIEWSATPVIGHAKDCLCSFALLVSVLGEYTASALGSLELSSSSCLQNPTSVSAK